MTKLGFFFQIGRASALAAVKAVATPPCQMVPPNVDASVVAGEDDGSLDVVKHILETIVAEAAAVAVHQGPGLDKVGK